MLVKSNTQLHLHTMEPTLHIPSTILWTQTLDSITLQIQRQHVEISLSQRCLKLSNKLKSMTLPLFGPIHVNENDIEHIANSGLIDSIITLRLIKEQPSLWPHLLMRQTDEELQRYLSEANLSIEISYRSSPSLSPTFHDTVDFETIINGHGEKTGL
ncbi:hypothetical protein EDC96DRAFT_521049, partial [Choanephora cucurbitarum]